VARAGWSGEAAEGDSQQHQIGRLFFGRFPKADDFDGQSGCDVIGADPGYPPRAPANPAFSLERWRCEEAAQTSRTIQKVEAGLARLRLKEAPVRPRNGDLERIVDDDTGRKCGEQNPLARARGGSAPVLRTPRGRRPGGRESGRVEVEKSTGRFPFLRKSVFLIHEVNRSESEPNGIRGAEHQKPAGSERSENIDDPALQHRRE